MSDGLAELPPLRAVIAQHGLSARKALGQNFLLDLNLTRRIARAAGPLAGRSVLEIGPGPGGLTRALLLEGAARVVAVERDPRCLPALAEIAAVAPGRLTVIEADALALDEGALFEVGVAPLVIANLPYHIGTALLVKWLTAADWPPWWAGLTLMFQREVALRIAARAGDAAYGRLSVLARWRTEPRLLFDVAPRAFTPSPKVTSSVVALAPRAEPLGACPLAALEAVTQAAFSQRRKMLRGSLKSLGVPVEALLAAAGLPGEARAEEIDVAGFAALARTFADLRA